MELEEIMEEAVPDATGQSDDAVEL